MIRIPHFRRSAWDGRWQLYWPLRKCGYRVFAPTEAWQAFVSEVLLPRPLQKLDDAALEDDGSLHHAKQDDDEYSHWQRNLTSETDRDYTYLV